MTIVTNLPAATFENALQAVQDWDGTVSTLPRVITAVNWLTEAYQCDGLSLSADQREAFGFALTNKVHNLFETVKYSPESGEALTRKPLLEQLYDALIRTGYHTIGGTEDSVETIIRTFAQYTQVRSCTWDFRDTSMYELRRDGVERSAHFTTALGGWLEHVRSESYDGYADLIGSMTLLWDFETYTAKADTLHWLQLDREGGIKVSVGPNSTWFEDRFDPHHLILNDVQIGLYFDSEELVTPDWVCQLRLENHHCRRLVIDTTTGGILQMDELEPLP